MRKRNYISMIRLSTLTVICLLLFSTGAGAERITDGLLALYCFDEGLGSTTVHDSSGFGGPTDLTIPQGHLTMGRATWINGGGVSITENLPGTEISSGLGGAAKLDAALEQTDEITIEAWVRPVNITEGDRFNPAAIVTMGLGSNRPNFELYQLDDEYGGYVELTLNQGARIPDDSGIPGSGVIPGKLQHIVYTNSIAAGTANIFVDDVLRFSANSYASDGFFIFDPGYPLAIGNRPQSDGYWHGDIYLVAVYNRALSVTEIDLNYTHGPICIPEPSTAIIGSLGLLGLLSFAHTSTQRARISSSNPATRRDRSAAPSGLYCRTSYAARYAGRRSAVCPILSPSPHSR
jgi:hypothetical protein